MPLVAVAQTLTVVDVMSSGLSRNRIYWLAHRDRWRRATGRPVRYLAEDVIKTLGEMPD